MAALRDDRRDLDLDLTAGRLLPEERVGARTGFAQLEEAGTRLVGRSGRSTREDEHDQREQRARPHFAPPSALAALAGALTSAGASIVTVYFASNAL